VEGFSVLFFTFLQDCRAIMQYFEQCVRPKKKKKNNNNDNNNNNNNNKAKARSSLYRRKKLSLEPSELAD
jgi:hypothetical protein